MKKLIYFIEICILCVTIATGCTNNETKGEQEVTNSVEETIKDTTKQEESNVAVEVKGERLAINTELFKEQFNFIATNIDSDITNISKIEEWKHEIKQIGNNSEEVYTTFVDTSRITLAKLENEENFVGVVVDNFLETQEEYNHAVILSHLIATICEDSKKPDEFIDNMFKAFDDAMETNEEQYVYGEKMKYAFSYNDELKMMTFAAVPLMEIEKQIIKESNNKTSQNETITDTSTPTEREIEIYNYINDLLEIGADTSQEPSVSEIASYFGISEEMVDGNYKAYKQGYLEHTYEDYCDKLTSEKYGISIDEVNKIWTKVYSYENK